MNRFWCSDSSIVDLSQVAAVEIVSRTLHYYIYSVVFINGAVTKIEGQELISAYKKFHNLD
jgi:hypothetical protein